MHAAVIAALKRIGSTADEIEAALELESLRNRRVKADYELVTPKLHWANEALDAVSEVDEVFRRLSLGAS